MIVRVSHGDHPRVCGEKRNSSTLRKLFWGSPPRMRGKGNRRILERQTQGITPAYAGKSPERLPIRPFRRDHPRVCGEKLVYNVLYYACKGSPPRMRGKAGPTAAPCPALRITPAYAGKRHGDGGLVREFQDHPRVCGEKHPQRGDKLDKTGSPPRMRGKETCKKACEVSWGITPAYAGKSLS